MSESDIIEFDSIDSTNNYAMHLIDDDKARHGTTIVTAMQTGGRGQRGRSWADVPGKSLLMSIIIQPRYAIHDQFAFNASIAVAVANILQKLYEHWQLYIKWPNDIILNDKKTAGILIENVIRGSRWTHSVIGIGLNVSQNSFPDLPFATSLKIESGMEYGISSLRDAIRHSVIYQADLQLPPAIAMNEYNNRLYKRGLRQKFAVDSNAWEATIEHVNTNGTLEVTLDDGTSVAYQHGQVAWQWE